MHVLETERLALRWLESEDSPFIYQLLNDPSWLRYIGDMGIDSLSDAEKYIRNGPVKMYQRFGFGLYLVRLKESKDSIGICGLLKRDSLTDVDLGFAYLPTFWRNGYASESANATMSFAKKTFRLSRLVAITSQENHPSGKLLEKLGFTFERLVQLNPADKELNLYGRTLP